jgi:hypothetical protein
MSKNSGTIAMWEKIRKYLGLSISPGEYRATVNALNIFFGAVIGVSLGQTIDMPEADYMLLLAGTSAFVTGILYVSYSERRARNIVILILTIGAAWYSLSDGSPPPIEIPPKLLPTLTVWAAMAILTELMAPVRKLDTIEE